MKRIESFDDCLAYVQKMGFVQISKVPGWIPIWQDRACALCDAIRDMSGNHTWYHAEFRPFGVRFDRKGKRVAVTYWGTDVVAGNVYIE